MDKVEDRKELMPMIRKNILCEEVQEKANIIKSTVGRLNLSSCATSTAGP